VTRFEALRAKARLFGDPAWTKAFMSGDVEARNSFAEITTTLQATGGSPKGEELKVGEYSMPESPNG
jgi:hypothetical protein